MAPPRTVQLPLQPHASRSIRRRHERAFPPEMMNTGFSPPIGDSRMGMIPVQSVLVDSTRRDTHRSGEGLGLGKPPGRESFPTYKIPSNMSCDSRRRTPPMPNNRKPDIPGLSSLSIRNPLRPCYLQRRTPPCQTTLPRRYPPCFVKRQGVYLPVSIGSWKAWGLFSRKHM